MIRGNSTFSVEGIFADRSAANAFVDENSHLCPHHHFRQGDGGSDRDLAHFT